MKTKKFTESDLLYAVATFNADPYCVEDDEQVAEIMSEIEDNGATMVTDEDERELALAKLDLPADSQRIVYKAGGCLFSIDEDEYTYDVVFNDNTDSNSKGFRSTRQECEDYIRMYNGTNESYFADYKGGSVQIVCNETGEEVYAEEIPNGKECWEDMFIEEKERNLREIMETYQPSEYKSAADMAYNIRVGYENDPEWFNFEVKNLDRFESVVADMIADEFDNEAEA